VTTGEGMRPGCMMKILEAERWLKGTNFRESEKTRCIRGRKDMVAFQGEHAPRSSPYGTGAGSRASCKLAQGRRSQTATRGACNCPAVRSIPPLSPRPAGERADSHAGGMQPRQVGAPLRLPTHPAWRPRPTSHETSTPVATCEQLHRHSRHYRASSTAEPVRDSRQPCV
jgi:hypothetical protein